jgi:hypothetical protein
MLEIIFNYENITNYTIRQKKYTYNPDFTNIKKTHEIEVDEYYNTVLSHYNDYNIDNFENLEIDINWNGHKLFTFEDYEFDDTMQIGELKEIKCDINTEFEISPINIIKLKSVVIFASRLNISEIAILSIVFIFDFLGY